LRGNQGGCSALDKSAKSVRSLALAIAVIAGSCVKTIVQKHKHSERYRNAEIFETDRHLASETPKRPKGPPLRHSPNEQN